jgi:CheY-like chemotaxis protein
MAREILIADSDKGDQEEFKKIFEMKDCRLIFSENGEDALEQVKFFKPDLIIADTALSEKSGLQVCSALKADREFKHIPVVLLKGTFEEISERDLEHTRADGVISKPLHEGEILGLVDRLMEEGAMKTKTESLLEDLDKFDDQQIIELTDVVEEPESRVRIDDLMASEKEEIPGEIADFVSLEKQLEKVTQPQEEELSFSLGEAIKEEVKPKAVAPSGPQEAKGEELFEKVALEEIFLKMEQIKPAIEKELLGEEEVHIAEEAPSAIAETVEKPFSLEEFEAALEKEPMPKPEEKMVQPFMPEPPKREAPKKEVLPEIPPFDLPAFEIPTKKEPWVPEAKKTSVETLWGEEMKEIKKEPLKEVLPSKPMLEEEELTMEALEQALGPLVEPEAKKGGVPKAPAKEVILEEEPLAELVEEEFPQELLAEAGLTQEKLPEEELREEEFPKALLGEERREEAVVALEEPEEEKIEEIEQVTEEVAAPTFLQAEEVRVAEMPLEQKVIAPEEIPPPRPAIKEGAPKVRLADKQLEAIIAKGVQAMMEDFITKIVPEMTQNILGVTVDRIEKMVKEIVPGMAEKAIQEEIKRLQEEEKE